MQQLTIELKCCHSNLRSDSGSELVIDELVEVIVPRLWAFIGGFPNCPVCWANSKNKLIRSALDVLIWCAQDSHINLLRQTKMENKRSSHTINHRNGHIHKASSTFSSCINLADYLRFMTVVCCTQAEVSIGRTGSPVTIT